MFSRWFKWFSTERRLRLKDEELPSASPPPAAPPCLLSHTLTSVAIVEDNAPLRSIIRRILDTESDLYVIGEASDGLAGRELLRNTHPAVLVTDLVLPGLSGAELIRFAREEFPEIAIVAVSIHAEDPYLRSALDNGAMAFVHKSCLHDHLAEAVRSAVLGKQYLSLP